MITIILILGVCFVAYTNGANANFKGVASLYGSGTTTLRQAAMWGTACTFAGSLVSMIFADEMLKSFSGKGLVADSIVDSREFVAAVALGAALTSFLATRLGFPVSTTHALVGSLVGAGLAAGSEVQFGALVHTFVFPLFFSPMIAALLGGVVYLLLRTIGWAPVQRTLTLDVCHFLSAGGASFARGLNDTPKMVALFLVLPEQHRMMSFLIVALMIALGGIYDIARVAETLGRKVTMMDAGQAFSSCLVTACLVTTASMHSLPVSTTHVSVGSLTGMGIVTGQAYRRKVIEILSAWISTVPISAALAGMIHMLLS